MGKTLEQKPRTSRGVIAVTRRGVGYLPHESFERDIEIPPEQLGGAYNGDEVVVAIRGGGRGRRVQGAVTEVVSRAQETFVGVLAEAKRDYVLEASDPCMYGRIRIASDECGDANLGDKVLVRVTDWGTAAAQPRGTVERVFGPAGAHETEMQATLATHGFQSSFPPAVEDAAEHIAVERTLSDAEIEKRRDMRDVPTFTIDPSDAKDFDDALSVRTLGDEIYEIGIHIADVTHYVEPGDALDTEARHRATSVYLVDRTIPMLPEILSNDICSLRPDEDRLTFSALFTMRSDGTVTDRWFGRTVIHSNRRFTYREAQDVLDAGDGPYSDELQNLQAIARHLRAARERKGALTFDTDEVKFELDADGKPLRAYVKERLETMRIIEDFMLLANREVAEHIADHADRNRVFIYRIHDTPDPDKLEELRIFLRAIGHDLGTGKTEQISSKDINELLENVRGTPEETMVQMATLRSMAKAIYSHKNIGHFSLAFNHYTHFTSPIRRYPDMMVHRLLAAHLSGERLPKQELEAYRKAAIHSSQREVEAVAAERDSTKFKQVEYMSEYIGQTFDGIITGITDSGMFVAEAKTRSEGMIRLSSLKDDYYEFSKKRYALIGQRTKTTYQLGDGVRIKLLRADVDERKIDWELVT